MGHLLWKPKTAALVLWGAVSLISILLMIDPYMFWGHGVYQNLMLHTVIEMVCAMCVLIVGMLLTSHAVEDHEYLIFPALGMVAMGVLNLAHAVVPLDRGFVLLNNLMLFVGGVGFALGWVKARLSVARVRLISLALIAFCIMLSILIWLRRDWFPKTFDESGNFSTTSVATNLLAGIFYLIGTAAVVRRYIRTSKSRDFFLVSLGLFSGIASLMFFRSQIGSEIWWIWHGLRLVAVLSALVYILYRWDALHRELLEREKENRCMFKIADLGNQAGISLSDLLRRAVEIIPRGFEQPALTEASIELDGRLYQSVRFRAGGQLLSAELYTEGKPAGRLDVMNFSGKNFLAEEQVLLQAVATQISQIVSEKHMEKKLRDTVWSLQESNRDLEQFAYVASHDLQEPLRMVSSYVQLVERRCAAQLDDDAREFIQFAVDGASRMRLLINGLLEYSRINTQGVNFKSISVEEALEHALQNLEVSINTKRAQITRDPMPEVRGDPLQITRLLQNLIGNALKFCDQAVPQIHVGCNSGEGSWNISVTDNGIGIDPVYAAKVFVIFQRLNGREQYEGSGMGLAICKRIVERHGGKISVEPGKESGSVFTFTLPKLKEKTDEYGSSN